MYEEIQGTREGLDHGPGEQISPESLPCCVTDQGEEIRSTGCVYMLSACIGKPFILFSVLSPSNLSSISTIEQMFNT